MAEATVMPTPTNIWEICISVMNMGLPCFVVGGCRSKCSQSVSRVARRGVVVASIYGTYLGSGQAGSKGKQPLDMHTYIHID